MTRAELRAFVIARDGACLASLLDRTHQECRDRWGDPHRPDDLRRLTLEHVREHPGGMRRDEPGWCVTLCHEANAVEHWGSTSEHRALLNAYLRGVRAAQ